MKGKIALVVGAAAGYVLGTRDGRGRYEEIKTRAESLWHDPKVQEKVSQAKQNIGVETAGAGDAFDSAPTTAATPTGGVLDD